jgi:hypothetical protein
MKTLMRNGRDRRSENPGWATRRKSARFWLGPISGSHQGQRPNGCIRRPDTWLHPNASLISQIPLAPRAPSIHGPSRKPRPPVVTAAFWGEPAAPMDCARRSAPMSRRRARRGIGPDNAYSRWRRGAACVPRAPRSMPHLWSPRRRTASRPPALPGWCSRERNLTSRTCIFISH